MHGCLWRTPLPMFAGYLQGTVQAFALQLYQALDLWESKILLSTQFFSQKEHFSHRCQECKTKLSDWCPAACERGQNKAERTLSLLHSAIKMLPQNCRLVGEMQLQILQAVFLAAKGSDLKPWITGGMGSPSSSCWHCPALHKELLRTARIRPLSSHTPGPSDRSKITALRYAQMGALLQRCGRGLNEKENEANTGHLSTCLHPPINLPLDLNPLLIF